ncbi:MAG TPA: polyketide cyclase [Xanthomonadales bacterium]|nr:polyketide cyclase [Xanthomonadales bacterium]
MTRFLELVVALLIVFVVLVTVGALLPEQRRIEETVETNRPVRIVYDILNGFTRFEDWNSLRLKDPRIRYSASGPQFGEGARLEFNSFFKSVGSGSWTLTKSSIDGDEARLSFEIQDSSFGEEKRMDFFIERKQRTTEITQRYTVKYGWDLRGRFAGIYAPRNFGRDIRKGLDNLSALLATIPNFDYSDVIVRSVDIPAQNILYMETKSERNITAVENATLTQLKWIKQVMDKNDLVAAGPFRLVTTNFGSDTYEFDIQQPVRRKGGEWPWPLPETEADPAEAGSDALADDSESLDPASKPDSFGAEDLPLVEAMDPTSVVLEGEVQLGRSYQGRALKAEYRGHPAGLPVKRDQLRAWAETRGELVHDRAFEEYLQDIETTTPEDSEFNVYWPVSGKTTGDGVRR